MALNLALALQDRSPESAPAIYYDLDPQASSVEERLHTISGALERRRVFVDRSLPMPLPLRLIAAPRATAVDLVAHAREQARPSPPVVVVVDWVQRLFPHRGPWDASASSVAARTLRERRWARAAVSVVASLRELAVDLQVAVVLLSALPRAIDYRADKRPVLGDFAEAVGLPVSAVDRFVALFRADYYQEGGEVVSREPMELIVWDGDGQATKRLDLDLPSGRVMPWVAAD